MMKILIINILVALSSLSLSAQTSKSISQVINTYGEKKDAYLMASDSPTLIRFFYENTSAVTIKNITNLRAISLNDCLQDDKDAFVSALNKIIEDEKWEHLKESSLSDGNIVFTKTKGGITSEIIAVNYEQVSIAYIKGKLTESDIELLINLY